MFCREEENVCCIGPYKIERHTATYEMNILFKKSDFLIYIVVGGPMDHSEVREASH